MTNRPIALLRDEPLTEPHAEGALVIDETGVRKVGTPTAHVGYQYVGTSGKMAQGIVSLTCRWADQQVYYPLHVRPYTPAARLAGGKQDPAFRTKPQLELVHAARAAGIPFRVMVANRRSGEHPEVTRPWGERTSRSCSPSSLPRSSGRRRPSARRPGRLPIACVGARARTPASSRLDGGGASLP